MLIVGSRGVGQLKGCVSFISSQTALTPNSSSILLGSTSHYLIQVTLALILSCRSLSNGSLEMLRSRHGGSP